MNYGYGRAVVGGEAAHRLKISVRNVKRSPNRTVTSFAFGLYIVVKNQKTVDTSISAEGKSNLSVVPPESVWPYSLITAAVFHVDHQQAIRKLAQKHHVAWRREGGDATLAFATFDIGSLRSIQR
jgi:hypothetical protein